MLATISADNSFSSFKNHFKFPPTKKTGPVTQWAICKNNIEFLFTQVKKNDAEKRMVWTVKS